MAALIAITMTCQSQAAQVTITSPDRGETSSDSSIASRGLHWNASQHELTAVITFSNQNYVSPSTHRHDDTLAFALPGVRYDQAANVFYAVSEKGGRTPIATFKPVLFGKKIQLLPGATIYSQQNHGNVSVKLITGAPSSAPHWEETY